MQAAASPARTAYYTRPWMADYQTTAVFNDSRYAVVEASTKSGKTAACLVWLLEQAMQGRAGQNFWWVAPVYSQAEIAYGRMKLGIPRSLYTANETQLRITLANGAVLWFKSAEKPDNLYGEDVYAAVVDEASRVREESWHAVRSTLTATRGPVRIIGNVKGRQNWAYRMARRAESGEADMAYARITAGDAVRAGVLDSAEIADARATLPEAVFKELYEAEPSDDEGNPFGYAAIRACIAPLSKNPPFAWGWDLARSNDWTVGIALDAQGHVCQFHRWNQTTLSGMPQNRRENPTELEVCRLGINRFGQELWLIHDALGEGYGQDSGAWPHLSACVDLAAAVALEAGPNLDAQVRTVLEGVQVERARAAHRPEDVISARHEIHGNTQFAQSANGRRWQLVELANGGNAPRIGLGGGSASIGAVLSPGFQGNEGLGAEDARLRRVLLHGIDCRRLYTGLKAAPRRTSDHRTGDSHPEYWDLTIRRVRQLTGRTGALVDSTGPGGPIDQALSADGLRNIEGYVFTSRSKQMLMEGLAVAIQQREISYPDGPIPRELEVFEYEYTRTGVKYSAPEGMHDDCVTALALARAQFERSRAGKYEARGLASMIRAGQAVTVVPERRSEPDHSVVEWLRNAR